MAIILDKQGPGSPGEQETYDFWGKSNRHGRIELGHLHLAGQGGLGSDVTSGVYLQAYDSLHYMSMDISGPRQGWTLNRCPGPYEILCASKNAGIPATPDKGVGCFILAENGDIIIRAPKGRVRISGLDVDIHAEGPDNTRGSVNIDSNQSVNIDTPALNIKTERSISMFSSGVLDLVANTTLKMCANFVEGCSAASATLGSKTNPTSQMEFNQKNGF